MEEKGCRGETNVAAIRFGVTTDTLLFYARSPDARLQRQYRKNKAEYLESKFTHVDSNGRCYRLDNITSPSYRPNLIYEYKGYKPPAKGWAVSRERMEQMDAEGRLYLPKEKTKRIQRKRFLDELEGERVATDSAFLSVGTSVPDEPTVNQRQMWLPAGGDDSVDLATGLGNARLAA